MKTRDLIGLSLFLLGIILIVIDWFIGIDGQWGWFMIISGAIFIIISIIISSKSRALFEGIADIIDVLF